MNGLLERVDVERVLDRVDVDALLDRVSVDPLLDRVSVDRLLDRVSVDRLLDRADVAGIVGRANVGNVVTESASTAATSVLDFGRAQLAGLDRVVAIVVDRVFRRAPAPGQPARSIAGNPGGAFTRLVAYAIDASLVTALFALAVFVFTYLVNLFFESNFDPTQNDGALWAVLSVAFAGLYWWLGLALVGRTVGKALIGLKVVRRDGAPVGPAAALVRVLVFPFSFILGLGFIPIVVARDRRALHDVAAGTIEVYDWGNRPAALPPRFDREAAGAE